MGAAIATTVSYFLVLLLNTHKSTAALGISFPHKEWFILLISSLLFFSVAYVTKQTLSAWSVPLQIIFSFLLGFLVYLLFLFWLKLLRWSELKYYARIILKNETV